MPPNLKKSINLAYLQNGTYDQIVTHLEKELEHCDKEKDGEFLIPTMTLAISRDNEN